MAICEVITYPDPLLKKRTEPVRHIDDSVRKLIRNMSDTLYTLQGVGLAAPQIGVSKQVIVYDIFREDLKEGLRKEERESKRKLNALINPKIIAASGEYLSENEGCLSVPSLRINVLRANSIVVSALDIDGNSVILDANEYLSVVIQHELDHLYGKLLVDYLSTLKREIYRRKLLKKKKKDEDEI